MFYWICYATRDKCYYILDHQAPYVKVHHDEAKAATAEFLAKRGCPETTVRIVH